MKPAGCLCKVDNLGRIVISSGSAIEIFTAEDGIMLKKYNPACIFCGNMENITSYKGKVVCEHCIRSLTELCED